MVTNGPTDPPYQIEVSVANNKPDDTNEEEDDAVAQEQYDESAGLHGKYEESGHHSLTRVAGCQVEKPDGDRVGADSGNPEWRCWERPVNDVVLDPSRDIWKALPQFPVDTGDEKNAPNGGEDNQCRRYPAAQFCSRVIVDGLRGVVD